MIKDSSAAFYKKKITELNLSERHDPCLEDKLLLESMQVIGDLEFAIESLSGELLQTQRFRDALIKDKNKRATKLERLLDTIREFGSDELNAILNDEGENEQY